MKIKVFEPPLPDFDRMAYGGEVKPRKMFVGGEPNIGFVPDMSKFSNPDISAQIQKSVAEALANQNLPDFSVNIADLEERLANISSGVSEQDVASQISQALTSADTVSSKDLTEALSNIPTGNATRDELRELAEEIFREQRLSTEGADLVYGQGGYNPAQSVELREQEIETILDRLLSNAGITGGTQTAAPVDTGVSQETVTQTIQDMLTTGTLTPEEIQRRIDAGDLTKDDVLSLIEGGFELSEEQLAQLFESGILTREEIANLIDQAIADIDDSDEEITEEEIAEIAAASGLTEEQVSDLISSQLEGYSPDVDMSTYATQEQLGSYATQEDLAGLESMFQNYLTPEQLESYLPQEGQYVTPEQLAEATANDYDDVIKGLTDKLGELETQYQNVTDQYEADAVNAQINKTKDDLNTFFAGAVPSGPRTGSTSQFSSGASFLPGGSPMANLIAGQRQGLGQDPFSTYLKTFTPSYSAYDAPVTAEEYGQASLPLISTQYSNPFTGGASYRGSSPTSATTAGADGRQYGLTVMPDDDPGGYNQGGQISNGIMDLTNFQTNVQPFQNAFRPNVPRN